MDISYGFYDGFGDTDESAGGKSDQFCDAAAAVWASVKGNAEEAEAYRIRCKKRALFDPWTEIGRSDRGLPWAWSSNAEFTSNPGNPPFYFNLVGAALTAAEQAVSKAAPAIIDKATAAAAGLFTGGESGKSTVPASQNMLPAGPLAMRSTKFTMINASNNMKTTDNGMMNTVSNMLPGGTSGKLLLVGGGIAALAVVFLMMKNKGSFAGYSSKRHAKRHVRRAKRSHARGR